MIRSKVPHEPPEFPPADGFMSAVSVNQKKALPNQKHHGKTWQNHRKTMEKQ